MQDVTCTGCATESWRGVDGIHARHNGDGIVHEAQDDNSIAWHNSRPYRLDKLMVGLASGEVWNSVVDDGGGR